ncbi:hypothetical protein BC936DRAFT_143129 [Jimgerdemannia flammicorona]|uniref:Uncharacterized protein n=2 Tax=Jimgerdemannia flammicorona TaxID=994334 RepID=A0A433QRB5_9FUNG|nr:hypothetical protein BC936DRAFT_143129 [Jimgerdemannia flammicorona]RUS32311.1 hypothetical protein BC938DRAFT_475764 [Jimgerdemannia flammicorona]
MTAQLQTELDLDSLVHLETMFEELGHKDGIRDGRRSGTVEGRVLGCEKGFELAREVYFYSGCAAMWLRLTAAFPDRFPARTVKQLRSLQSLIEAFPTENSLNTEILALLDKIRAKYKVVTSLLGVTQKYQAIDKPAMTY